MQFKKILFFLMLSLVFTACDKIGVNPGANETNTSDVKTDATTDANGELVVPRDVKEYKIPVVDKCQKPKSVRELSSGIEKLFYQVTSDNSASLNIFGGNGISLSKKEMMLIVDFIQYKDMKCDEGPVRYGVGVRLFLHIKKTSKGVNISDLRYLAANVQLDKASVQYRLKTIGVTGDKINSLFPKSAVNNFDVEGYADVVKAVDKIQELIRDNVDGVIIDPQPIPVVQ